MHQSTKENLFFNVRIALRFFYIVNKFALTPNRGKINLAHVVRNTGIQRCVKRTVLNQEKKISLGKDITIQREIVVHVGRKTT